MRPETKLLRTGTYCIDILTHRGMGMEVLNPRTVQEKALPIGINMTEIRSDKTRDGPKEHLRCCWSPSQLGAFCVFRLKATEEQCRSRLGLGPGNCTSPGGRCNDL